MDDEGQRPPGTIGTLWAAPEKKLGAEPKQLDLWPAAQSATNAAVGGEEQHAASVEEGAPVRACDQRTKPKFLPIIIPPAASSCDYEIRAPRRDARPASECPKLCARVRPGDRLRRQNGSAGDGGRSRQGRRSRRKRRQSLARALAQPAPRERCRQQRPIDDQQHRASGDAGADQGFFEARGGAGDAADHGRGLDDPRGRGRDGGARRAERRLARGTGRYGAGGWTDRFDRALGQPLDRRDQQGPDLDARLIFNRAENLVQRQSVGLQAQAPSPGRQMRKTVTRITDGARMPSYIPLWKKHPLGRRGHVMTWTSDRTGVLLYTVIGMLFVLSTIYLPA